MIIFDKVVVFVFFFSYPLHVIIHLSLISKIASSFISSSILTACFEFASEN